eukprot:g2664.t1
MVPRPPPARLEFHVTWSATYRVPALFFLARDDAGAPAPPSRVRAALGLDGGTGAGASEEPWTMLTQEEHPHSRALAYCLHPCETEGRMALLQAVHGGGGGGGGGGGYLLAWFALVAPAARLELRPHTFTELARRLCFACADTGSNGRGPV